MKISIEEIEKMDATELWVYADTLEKDGDLENAVKYMRHKKQRRIKNEFRSKQTRRSAQDGYYLLTMRVGKALEKVQRLYLLMLKFR